MSHTRNELSKLIQSGIDHNTSSVNKLLKERLALLDRYSFSSLYLDFRDKVLQSDYNVVEISDFFEKSKKLYCSSPFLNPVITPSTRTDYIPGSEGTASATDKELRFVLPLLKQFEMEKRPEILIDKLNNDLNPTRLFNEEEMTIDVFKNITYQEHLRAILPDFDTYPLKFHDDFRENELEGLQPYIHWVLKTVSKFTNWYLLYNNSKKLLISSKDSRNLENRSIHKSFQSDIFFFTEEEQSHKNMITFLEVKSRLEFQDFKIHNSNGNNYCSLLFESFMNVNLHTFLECLRLCESRISQDYIKENIQKLTRFSGVFRQLTLYAIRHKICTFILTDGVTVILLRLDSATLRNIIQCGYDLGVEDDKFEVEFQNQFENTDMITCFRKMVDLHNRRNNFGSKSINISDYTFIPFSYSVFDIRYDAIPIQTVFTAIINELVNHTKKEDILMNNKDIQLIAERIKKTTPVKEADSIHRRNNGPKGRVLSKKHDNGPKGTNSNQNLRPKPQPNQSKSNQSQKGDETSISSIKRSFRNYVYNISPVFFLDVFPLVNCIEANIPVNEYRFIGKPLCSQDSSFGLSKVFAISKTDLLKSFPMLKDRLDIDVLTETLTMKLYEDEHLASYDYLNFSTDFSNFHQFYENLKIRFFNECSILKILPESFTETNKENPSPSQLRIPIIYAYGSYYFKIPGEEDSSDQSSIGKFLLMNYIEPDDELSLHSIVNGNNGDLKRKYFDQACEQLDLLHSNGVYHQDIALRNMIISKEDKNLYLIDFSLSVRIDYDELDSENEELINPYSNHYQSLMQQDFDDLEEIFINGY